MTNQKVLQNHVCDETLVSDFIDNRMSDVDRKQYLQKIEICTSIRKCNHCKKLIHHFLSLKQHCTKLGHKDSMPVFLESQIMKRIQASYKKSLK